MNLSRVINVWINTTLKDLLEFLRFGVGSLGQSGEMNVQESRTYISENQLRCLHMTEVEQTDVPEINWFLMKHLLRNHVKRNTTRQP